MQFNIANVSGKPTRENLSTWMARRNLTWAGVSFGTGLGGAGGMSAKVRMFSDVQLLLWFKYGWGESVGSCWLHRVSLRPFYKIQVGFLVEQLEKVKFLTFDGFLLMDILLAATSKNFSKLGSFGGGGGTIGFGIGESPLGKFLWIFIKRAIEDWIYLKRYSLSSIPSKPWRRKQCKRTWKHRPLSNKRRVVNSPGTLHVVSKV